jgi:formate dehydrogenase subunit gamma
VSGKRRELVRFDLTERLVHWALAVIVIVLLATGAELWFRVLSVTFGHRALVEEIHVYVGLAIPAPLLVGALGPWRKALLADLRRLNHWPSGEARWFKPGGRRPRIGKFNPGQKLNAALLGGALLLMIGTGILMRWASPSLLRFQRGATTVHDLGFVLIGVLVAGHIVMALTHPEAMRSMVHGRVSEAWAKLHAPRWLDEERRPEAAAGDERGTEPVAARR